MSGRQGERGTASAELVVLVIPIMVLVGFAVFVGRYSATNQEVTSAARDAARAAAVRGSPAGAQAAGVVYFDRLMRGMEGCPLFDRFLADVMISCCSAAVSGVASPVV